MKLTGAALAGVLCSAGPGASGFFPEAGLGWVMVAGAFLPWLLSRARRRWWGPPRAPVSEALALAALSLFLMEGWLAGQFRELTRPAYSPHPLLRWDLPYLDRSRPGKGRAPLAGLKPGFTVLCLGDSATYGVGVPHQDAWPHVSEWNLRAAGRGVRFLNHGVPGYSTVQTMAWFEREGLALRPDLLVLASSHNDLQHARKADFSWIGEGVTLREARRWVMGSVLAQVLRARLWAAPHAPELESLAGGRFRVSLPDRRRALDRVVGCCRTRGIPAALLLMPRRAAAGPALDYAEDLRAYAAEQRLLLVDALALYDAHPAPDTWFPPGGLIHPSAQGHGFVAAALVEALVRSGLVPP